MRTHTDPGLLTATAMSATPGLEVLDGESGEWVDAEVACAAGDVVLMCGEALEVMTRGRFRACAHRVRHAPTPRISVVFELRLHDAVPLAPLVKKQFGATVEATQLQLEKALMAGGDVDRMLLQQLRVIALEMQPFLREQ